jgi:hypothetical protein
MEVYGDLPWFRIELMVVTDAGQAWGRNGGISYVFVGDAPLAQYELPALGHCP